LNTNLSSSVDENVSQVCKKLFKSFVKNVRKPQAAEGILFDSQCTFSLNNVAQHFYDNDVIHHHYQQAACRR